MRKILLLLTTFLILAVGTSCSNSEILYSANTQTVEEICSDCDSDSMLVYHVYSDSLVTADGEVFFVQNYDCNHDSLTGLLPAVALTVLTRLGLVASGCLKSRGSRSMWTRRTF